MNALASYVISVTAAGIICGIVTCLLGEKGAVSELGKMLTGIFLAVMVIQPILHIRFDNLDDYLQALSLDGNKIAESGKTMAEKQVAGIIKKQVEAYILDKAASMGVELSVEVVVEENDLPVLAAVRLCGRVSPSAKQQLVAMIEKELGIARENQIWIGMESKKSS